MRVQILSDLHLEFDADGGAAFVRGLPVVGDVLVLAGDVVPLQAPGRIAEVLGWFCGRFPQVVYVAGNHEHFGSAAAAVAPRLRAVAAALPNLHVLDGSGVELGGLRFVGATLWFGSAADDARFTHLMNDFRHIEALVPWVHQTHAAHVAFLEAAAPGADVVVTHHLPHPRSIAPRYLAAPTNRFFVTPQLAPLVERCGAALWVHGHTHTSCDYVAGGTRVICNPRGYPGERDVPAALDLAVAVAARRVSGAAAPRR